jgi:hypothetical protein
MSYFLTDPDNPRAREQLKGDFDFKMALEQAWVDLGIPYDYARVATIDHKEAWIPLFKKRMSPQAVAEFLEADIRRSYKLDRKSA